MTARMTSRSAAGFVFGVLATWLLGIATNVLLLPFAAVALVAVVAWRQGLPVLAASAVVGSASVTLVFAWLFATLGDGLSQL